jgi:hypothetical protein
VIPSDSLSKSFTDWGAGSTEGPAEGPTEGPTEGSSFGLIDIIAKIAEAILIINNMIITTIFIIIQSDFFDWSENHLGCEILL